MKALLAAAALCTGPVCNFDTLAPWFARLAQATPAPGVPAVHILQIGDSHTAGDAVTGAWRDLLQAKAGDGGRGVLAPGRPYAGYLTRQITAAMSPGWTSASIPLGLSRYSFTATTPGATMSLAADPGHSFDRIVICATAGMLLVQLGNGTIQPLFLTASPQCQTIRTAIPQTSLTLTAPDAAISVTSWATFSDNGGVALSNLGVVGAQLQHLARIDDSTLAEELHAYAPDLLVLAFGTNEGFVPRFDPAAYEAILRTQIARLQSLTPGVPLLLLGPPDALSRNPALRTNADGPATSCGGSLFAPPALDAVRRIQRQVAGELHLAWWDWQARMGGPCSAARWTEAGLMRPDHVHFRTAGAALVARALQDDLEHAALEP